MGHKSKEDRRDYAREYYRKNRDRLLAMRRERAKDGRYDGCGKAWRKANPEKYKRIQLAWEHNITYKEFLGMLVVRGFMCDLCGKPMGRHGTKGVSAVIDHCHTTNTFRGVIHNSCNKGLGFLGDDYAGILKAAEYLNRHEN